ncbi:hypothetical protein ISS86_03300 [Candidatus Microgenomates bacterium]|nr:hypothetical protein [Candidatus Microgenomates bacterium]
MKTKQIYYQDIYKEEIEATIIEIQESAGSLLSNIVLDQTVFFPEGGGQPGDRGEIISKTGSVKIKYTRLVNDEIIHQGKMIDEFKKGDKVTVKIDWNWRYKYMKIHSAGHLVHDVLMSMVEGLKPLKGSHGKKAYLEYEGAIDVSIKEELEEKVNQAIEKDLSIVTKEASYEELAKECQFLPPNLPKDKMLRMLKIGDYPAMPDGGVHVKSTKEIDKVLITDLLSQEGKVRIKYRVVGG